MSSTKASKHLSLIFCSAVVRKRKKNRIESNKTSWIIIICFYVFLCIYLCRFAACGAKYREFTNNFFVMRNFGWLCWKAKKASPSLGAFHATKLFLPNCSVRFWCQLPAARDAVERLRFPWPVHQTASTSPSPWLDSFPKVPMSTHSS